MTEQRCNQLEQALELTRQLLALVEDGAWEVAAELEVERTRLIRQEAEAEPSSDLLQQIHLLHEIDVLNRKITSLGNLRKERLSDQLRKMHQGRKAEQAYQQRDDVT